MSFYPIICVFSPFYYPSQASGFSVRTSALFKCFWDLLPPITVPPQTTGFFSSKISKEKSDISVCLTRKRIFCPQYGGTKKERKRIHEIILLPLSLYLFLRESLHLILSNKSLNKISPVGCFTLFSVSSEPFTDELSCFSARNSFLPLSMLFSQTVTLVLLTNSFLSLSSPLEVV